MRHKKHYRKVVQIDKRRDNGCCKGFKSVSRERVGEHQFVAVTYGPILCFVGTSFFNSFTHTPVLQEVQRCRENLLHKQHNSTPNGVRKNS